MLTTEAVVAELPEEEKAPQALEGGGADVLGGIGNSPQSHRGAPGKKSL
jgi:hypothetical protein